MGMFGRLYRNSLTHLILSGNSVKADGLVIGQGVHGGCGGLNRDTSILRWWNAMNIARSAFWPSIRAFG